MKKLSFQKIGIFSLVIALPFVVSAQSSTNPSELVKQMQTLLNQYSEKIRILEAENKLFREAMAKHNIQIPLEEYNKIYGSSTQNANSTPAVTTSTNSVNAGQNELQKGFINQFRLDWQDIRKAYGMPADAQVGMYEFVVNEAQNNVFVNIFYNGGTPEGAYNAKLLYSFDKKTFKRTLIGLFEYNSENKGYVTKRGKNPFAGTERIRVMENATTPIKTETTAAAVKKEETNAVQNTTATTELERKLRELYLAKNYSQVFALSDAHLKNNPATYLIRFHRYRTYFAQGLYQKTMDEIMMMEKEKLADAKVYCDAYAVATVIKNNTLANKYKNFAGSGCKLTP